jgi:hypothetical protein
MSVDMYFTVKLYLEDKRKDAVLTIPENEDGRKAMSIPLSFVPSITLRIGQLCNAFQIHWWLVDNAFDGSEDFPQGMDGYTLGQLKEVCEKVLRSRELADTLLPFVRGENVGPYLEWYFQDLRDTVDIIDRMLDIEGRYGGRMYYSTIW